MTTSDVPMPMTRAKSVISVSAIVSGYPMYSREVPVTMVIAQKIECTNWA
jgi:cobyrinic acid a,c-diamide synthase